ncbi:MAG TPA: adenylate/guanylate cyclase domain-containing protein, partial [Candidatus Binatia bacterium]|nr:adenylate/guanylate cyclase domain-containing protein [Candidatus Binatia bacterium]
LHPVYNGRAFRWTRAEKQTTLTEYGRTDDDVGRWQRSPFYALEQSGESLLRRRLTNETDNEFSIFPELRAAGITDYLALASRFDGGETIGDMDGVYSSWASNAPEGFTDEQVADIRRIVPFVALAVKSATLALIAGTLVETYLGRDPGRRVLHGSIKRGVAERIEAVLWFSDLRGYTRLSDAATPDEIIPLLNEYAEAIISAIHDEGGDVLKLMGDGTLAIFTSDERRRCAEAALAASAAARRGVAEVNAQRAATGLLKTDVYVGLHIGDVFYGNIGSKERLDFTVIGPAVNEVSRIAAMCRSLEQPLLVSSAFAEAMGAGRSRLISVGRYALRGVGRPQELFTVE